MNTEMKKQRAVDYFYSQLTVIPFVEKMKMTGIFIPLEKYHDILEKAEAMEREQIEDAYDEGHSDCFNGEHKQYYNETYGGDK
jgi:hypothetical protein